MQRLEKLYEGKAKKLYKTDDPHVLWVEYMNQATAGNGAKKAQIDGKGSLNNRITSLLFDLLASYGIRSHFVARLSDTEQLVQHMTMYPLEIIMRNVAAGSFAKRYGLEEGTELTQPILEFCYKCDNLGDPFINDDGIVALGLVSSQELEQISKQARAINTALVDIFSSIHVQLVDFKIEIGKNADGEILLADEITPDTCRLWDVSEDGEHQQTITHLDKDLFRRDLGNLIPAYEEIYRRLVTLANNKNVQESIQ